MKIKFLQIAIAQWEHNNKLKGYFPELNFTKINSKYVDWEQMIIMSLCQHNIIANSSFSWFPSWLNSDKNKIVIIVRKNVVL